MSSSQGPGLRVTTTATTGGYCASGSSLGSSPTDVGRGLVGLVGLDGRSRPRRWVPRGRRLVLGRYRDGCVRRFERAHQGRQRTVDPFPPGHGSRQPGRRSPGVPEPGRYAHRHDHGAGGRCGGGALPPRARPGGRPRRGHRRRQHRRRRLVPRPLRLPRPRLRHLHPGRGPEPRDRLGPRRRDLRHHRRPRPLRRRHLVPPRRPRPRHPPVPHPAPARRRHPQRGDRPHHRGVGPRARGCCR